MVRHTLKILQHLLQNFKSVSDHFGTLCIKGFNSDNKTDEQKVTFGVLQGFILGPLLFLI